MNKDVFKKVLSGCFCCLILSVTSLGFSAASSTTITIYHTGDIHGRIDESLSGTYDKPVGIANVAAMKATMPTAFLVDTGDAFHGTPVAVLSYGEEVVKLMNDAGYDFVNIGSHDFNYGYQQLLKIRNLSKFMLASSNVKYNGKYDFDRVLIKKVNNVKVGFFGLITEKTATTVMPKNISNVEFENPLLTARRKVQELRKKGVQVIVAVTHLGEKADASYVFCDQIAKEVEGIDVIIDGHSHKSYPRGKVVNGVLIASSGQYGEYLGRVQLGYSNGKIVNKSATLLSGRYISDTNFGSLALDRKKKVLQKLTEIGNRFNTTLNRNVGTSNVQLSSAKSPGLRTAQTDLGYLVAESYRDAMSADIAIANGGDIRADLDIGTITYRELISILPFFNVLQSKEITPKILKEVLENGVSQITLDSNKKIDYALSPHGKFPQVAGFSFTYDVRLPIGHRVKEITTDKLGKLDLKDNTTKLLLAAPSFLMSGGDNYDVLKELPIRREYGTTAEEALIAYINKHSVTEVYFQKNNRNRIVMINE